MAKHIGQALIIQNQVAHVVAPAILILYKSRLAATVFVNFIAALHFMIARNRHHIGSFFHHSGNHAAPESVFLVLSHQVRIDNAFFAYGVGQRTGITVTHDHIAVKKQKIRTLIFNLADDTRYGLGALMPDSILLWRYRISVCICKNFLSRISLLCWIYILA